MGPKKQLFNTANKKKFQRIETQGQEAGLLDHTSMLQMKSHRCLPSSAYPLHLAKAALAARMLKHEHAPVDQWMGGALAFCGTTV
jgi:hypothetical protein